MKQIPAFVAALSTALISFGVIAGITSGAQANPSPSTTPSIAPTIGASGLYMFAPEGGAVSLRQINTTDGDASLAFPQTSMMTTLTGAAQNPTTSEVWAIRQDCRLYKVDMTTGALTSAPPTLLQPTYTCRGIAFDNTGQMFAIVTNTAPSPSESEWVVVDPSTGFYTTYGIIRDTMAALTYDPVSGRIILLWQIASPTSLAWISINPATHTESTVAPGLGNQHSNLAFTPSGRLFTVDYGELKTGTNAASITSLSSVGYTNGLAPLGGTLFWYTAPSPSTSPSSSTSAAATASANAQLANTGTEALGQLFLASLLGFAGLMLVALVPVVRRRK